MDHPAFPDTLAFRDAGLVAGSRVFELLDRYRYLSSCGLITVPAGFQTDGATIPRIFWTIFDPMGPYLPAAVVHDFLYSPGNTVFTRLQSDCLFYEAMYNFGIPWVTRSLIYRAVRIGGAKYFRAQLTK